MLILSETHQSCVEMHHFPPLGDREPRLNQQRSGDGDDLENLPSVDGVSGWGQSTAAMTSGDSQAHLHLQF